jgi:hypothetical protein
MPELDHDDSGPGLGVPVLFTLGVIAVCLAALFVVWLSAVGDDSDPTSLPGAVLGLPVVAVVLLLAWWAWERTEPLNEPRDWALPLGATVILLAATRLYGPSLLLLPIVPPILAWLRGPAARVFVASTTVTVVLPAIVASISSSI